MNKTELKNELQKYVNGSGFIQKCQLAQFMGYKDPNTVNKYLAGLEKVGRGFYLINDVAEAIVQFSSER